MPLYVNFGTASLVTPDKDCPVDGSWEAWCDCVYGAKTPLSAKCRSQPFGPLTAAPWTDVGAFQRGLPKENNAIPGLVSGGLSILQTVLGVKPQTAAAPPTPTTPAPQSQGLLGLPSEIALIGGGLLAAGLVALILVKKRRK